MRTLGRVFGVSLSSMHEMTQREDFDLGAQPSVSMVADIHTQAFPDSKAEEWRRLWQNASILSPSEILEKVGAA